MKTHGQRCEWQVNNYTLHSILSRSVLTTVYLGEHHHRRIPVVLKTLNSWQVNEKQIRQFWNEAQLHASLHHPHIVRVLDIATCGHIPFLVTEYAHGGYLQYTHQAHQIQTILPVISQIASALQYMHDRHLIHQDVKPHNILIKTRQEFLLCDFGTTITARPWNCRNNYDIAGTAIYAAPEQIEGYPCVLSDQYALAILVYSLLCGRPPFVGSSFSICQQHIAVQPAPLHIYVPTILPEVERVVLRALAKDPYQRYSSIRDFAQALQEAAWSSSYRPYIHQIT